MKKILITAGPTQEAIDPVRYLSNHSSGKMGYALAEAAVKLGHTVTLISGPTALPVPGGVTFIPVTSAQDMYRAVMKAYLKADVIIKAAAVADYRPEKTELKKIKKKSETLTLRLVKNPDILETLGRKKKKGQLLIGFAAETNRTVFHAKEKLKRKRCDWIILNNVATKGIGFGSDDNQVTLFRSDGTVIPLKKLPKRQLAVKVLDIMLQNDY